MTEPGHDGSLYATVGTHLVFPRLIGFLTELRGNRFADGDFRSFRNCTRHSHRRVTGLVACAPVEFRSSYTHTLLFTGTYSWNQEIRINRHPAGVRPKAVRPTVPSLRTRAASRHRERLRVVGAEVRLAAVAADRPAPNSSSIPRASSRRPG